MKKVCWRVLVFVVLQWGLSTHIGAAGLDDPFPPVDEVVQKVIARSKWARDQNFQRFYSFTKSTLTEDFDENGKIKSKEEKSCRVPARTEAPSVFSNGNAATTLGPDSNEPGKVQEIKSPGETSQPTKKRLIEIDEEAISHFVFLPLRRELISGRATLVFAFHSKPDLPIKRLQDRLVNKATGTIWVDEQEYEVVKADLRLKEPVNIVGGLIAAVQTFHYVFERTRVDEGVWLLAQTEMFIKARQLVSLVRTKRQQHWTDFKKATRQG